MLLHGEVRVSTRLFFLESEVVAIASERVAPLHLRTVTEFFDRDNYKMYQAKLTAWK